MTTHHTTSAMPSSAVALVVLAGTVQRRLDVILAEHQLNFRKYGTLGHVQREPGISLSELARRSRITAQSMHTVIGDLTGRGFVHSQIPSPGAPAQLTITPEGAVLLRALRLKFQQLDDELFGEDAHPAWQELGVAVLAATRVDLGM